MADSERYCILRFFFFLPAYLQRFKVSICQIDLIICTFADFSVSMSALALIKFHLFCCTIAVPCCLAANVIAIILQVVPLKS